MHIHKSLPAEFCSVKAAPSGALTFVISHEAPDLVGDIVVQRGMKPVSPRIPAQVDHSGKMADVIGYWDNLQTKGDYTTADLHLVERGISKMADLVRGLSDAGVKLAASIGFSSSKAEPIKPRGYKFLESMLHEISVVVVPAQPLALQVAKQFGITLDDARQQASDAKAGDSAEILSRARRAIATTNLNLRKSK